MIPPGQTIAFLLHPYNLIPGISLGSTETILQITDLSSFPSNFPL